MLILIDQIYHWNQISVLSNPHDPGERRTYYVAQAPYRALIVCRNNLKLGDLLNMVVDAKEWPEGDAGTEGLARVPGETQSKLTIFRKVPQKTRYRLSYWLRTKAIKDES